jgi:shikimate dehydrogenase
VSELNDENIKAYPRLYGLIGNPLSHSFSKKYFNEKFSAEGLSDCYYELFPLETIDAFLALIRRFPNLKGLNVTIPFKASILAFLDGIDETAREIGAVNTIKIVDGKCFGYNTDTYGFEKSLRSFLDENPAIKASKAIVLGTGGASKSVCFVLKKTGISYVMVSRTKSNKTLNYNDLDEAILQNTQLIVNTTPLGMAPDEDTFPKLNYNLLGANHFLYDLVYNPEKTVFLAKGEKQGCLIKNGLEMLHLQAEKAWEIWNF